MKTIKEYIEIDPKYLKLNPINEQVYGSEEADYSFIESIEVFGQLEKIVVMEDKENPGYFYIISGNRRGAALKILRKTAICRLVSYENDDEMKEYFFQYNNYRKKIMSHIVEEAKLIRPIVSEKARMRKITPLKQNADMRISAEREKTKIETGSTRDIVADILGVGRDVLEKAEKIKDKADAGDEHAKILMKKVDDSEIPVHTAYKLLGLIAEALSDSKDSDNALEIIEKFYHGNITEKNLNKKLKKIVKKRNEQKVDHCGKQKKNAPASEWTPTILFADFSSSHPPFEDIMHLLVPYSKPGVLCLLTTTSLSNESHEIIDWWGFKYKSMCIWDRDIKEPNPWFKGSHELLLIGTKGNMKPPDSDKLPLSIIHDKIGHLCVHKMIEEMFPGHRYIELFPKEQHEGWENWILEESNIKFKEKCVTIQDKVFNELDKSESIKMLLMGEEKQDDAQDQFEKWD